jgi:hypothetical protein
MTDNDFEYQHAREKEREVRNFMIQLLGGIAAFPIMLMLFTYLDNAGRPHRWAEFFYRLGLDYWSSPILQWLFR